MEVDPTLVVTPSSIAAPIKFQLPGELEASRPPELRGLRRDTVRLMLLSRSSGEIVHTRFHSIDNHLKPGDLLVVNNSRTIPAMLQAVDETGSPVEVRLAGRRSDDTWEVLLLDGRRHIGRPGMILSFGVGLTAYIIGSSEETSILWHMQFSRCCLQLIDAIYRLGEPVRYDYLEQSLPLDMYQTVYASEPGSVEMPSAGRPFSWELLLRLQKIGIRIAAITLHTGLSSSRDDAADFAHPIHPETYRIPAAAAEAILETRSLGGRILAVGTSVVRSLETVAMECGVVREAEGITRLRITRKHNLRVVDGLITGMHAPEASHLDLLTAFVSPDRLRRAYLEAIQRGYLWHEFGDMNLII